MLRSAVKRPRKKTLPGSEKDITAQIRKYLKSMEILHWKEFQGLGCVPGISDIIGIYRGCFLAIEVKALNGKATEAQTNFLADVNENGGRGIIARSVQDVEDLLTDIDKTQEGGKQ
jgi:hypothetical protein